MGLAEIRSKVVVEVKYDVSDARASLKHLAGDERKLAEATIARAELANKRIEDQIKKYGQLNAGLQAVQLTGINLGGSLEKLTGITGGLAAAGFALGGVWVGAIGLAGEAVGKLADHIFNADKRVQKALYESYANRMAAFDAFEDAGEKARQSYLAEIKAAHEADAAVGGVTRALHEHTGNWQKAKDAVTSYSLALAQVQEDRGGGFVDRQEIELTRSLRDAKIALTGASAKYGSVAAEAQIKTLRQKDAINDARAAFADGALSVGAYRDALRAAGVEIEDTAAKLKALREEQRRHSNKVASELGGDLVNRLEAEIEDDRARESSAATSSMIRGSITTGGIPAGGDVDDAMSKFYGAQGEFSKRTEKAYGEFQKSKQKSFLEGMLGPREEFNAYAEGFNMLSGAATSAYDAVVSGQMSAGEATKQFLKDSLKSLGSRMLVRGLEEMAEGFAALAGVYTAPLAAGHFYAAAAFGAGAAAAGVASSAISGGGRGGAARVPTPSYSGSSSGSGAFNGSPIIVYGDNYAEDSPRNRQIRARKLVNAVLGTSAGAYR